MQQVSHMAWGYTGSRSEVTILHKPVPLPVVPSFANLIYRQEKNIWLTRIKYPPHLTIICVLSQTTLESISSPLTAHYSSSCHVTEPWVTFRCHIYIDQHWSQPMEWHQHSKFIQTDFHFFEFQYVKFSCERKEKKRYIYAQTGVLDFYISLSLFYAQFSPRKRMGLSSKIILCRIFQGENSICQARLFSLENSYTLVIIW